MEIDSPRTAVAAAVLCLAFVLPWAAQLRAAPGADALPDVRILIDISGSMKKNDPENLRRPALRLLVGLLPKGSRAGVWTFGQYVNMQVPLGKVDRRWRQRARAGASGIHSRGLFTDIEAALNTATADWQGPPGKYRRSLVLLTDGMVDVAKDPQQSVLSRERVLSQVLPRLKQVGAAVHTIALSDRADHELMRTLAEATGGWSEQAATAAGLQRVFLHIFEQVGRPDTLPLKDNRFRVDKSVSELTLLIFRADGGAPTRIRMPDGSRFDFEHAPAAVTWHRDDGYDLLTIIRPAVGEWEVQAALDPDNRVMVVSDLKMRVGDLPNRFATGQRIPVSVSVEQQGMTITRKAFLGMLQVDAEMRDAEPAEPSEPHPLLDDGRDGDATAGDGIFGSELSLSLVPGKAELRLRIDGKTFVRERRYAFERLSPAEVTMAPDPSRGEGMLAVRVRPLSNVIEAGSLEPAVFVEQGDGTRRPLSMMPAQEGVWEGRLDTGTLSGTARLKVTVQARSLSGDPVTAELPPLTVTGLAPAVSATPKSVESRDANAGEAIAQPSPAAQDWAGIAVIFGSVNLGAMLLGLGGFYLLRRRRRRDDFVLLEADEAQTAVDETKEIRA